ncbi:hypothetical protein ACJMK2_039423 [Sinanodonta woodiana]|uniref:Uncharacterized protein n=1 Tax=Sinanodonta woodiana TaxID=1069815 RepID=A0ABD3WBY8_SINWO
MWVAPFNFDFYDNWLAVGMTSKGITDHADNDRWYKQMYYEETDERLQFRKMKYDNVIRDVTYADDGIQIEGNMSTTHHAQAKITIRPLSISDYADNIKQMFS